MIPTDEDIETAEDLDKVRQEITDILRETGGLTMNEYQRLAGVEPFPVKEWKPFLDIGVSPYPHEDLKRIKAITGMRIQEEAPKLSAAIRMVRESFPQYARRAIHMDPEARKMMESMARMAAEVNQTMMVLNPPVTELPVARTMVPWRTRLYFRLPRRFRRWCHLMRHIFKGHRAVTEVYYNKILIDDSTRIVVKKVLIKCDCGKVFT